MKKHFQSSLKSILLLIILSLPVCTQLTFAQEQKDLEEALEKFRLALISADESALLRLTSIDLTYGHSTGVIENQNEFIEALKSGPSKYINIAIFDQRIKIVDNVAWVRQSFLADVNTAEVLTKLNLGVLLVWKKEKDGWKLFARQGFRR